MVQSVWQPTSVMKGTSKSPELAALKTLEPALGARGSGGRRRRGFVHRANPTSWHPATAPHARGTCRAHRESKKPKPGEATRYMPGYV